MHKILSTAVEFAITMLCKDLIFFRIT
uniref:Uncharacterized protein n=1 Tax=Rhizophora mucronata TaxID=61149 RepID=A0A2P2PGH6_RHIMU